jgi:hypothetical protein
VHVEDVARICVACAEQEADTVLDAADLKPCLSRNWSPSCAQR